MPDIEKKSSAVTLSDMEIFVFPQLLYSIVLANIISPLIWEWRKDPWFSNMDKLTPYRRVLRLKQYIMEKYVFNLDLDTWGLTTKGRELARFRDILSEKDISRTNALFGYEGDKYYFDIDIRRHFGLDKYKDEIIPYWKTETVEAMDAFRYKAGYNTGAGECVSLSALYAAAMFIVARIPLSDIYIIGTPLHSQNYVDLDEGMLTNNRRIVTKNAWFNGTALSIKARRALENEKITVIAHESGYIHTLNKEATIDRSSYRLFTGKLNSFLRTELNVDILGNFLRSKKDIHKCIQVRWKVNDQIRYIALARIFDYEDRYNFFFTHDARKKLMDKIDTEEFHSSPIPNRLVLNDLEEYIRTSKPDFADEKSIKNLQDKFSHDCLNSHLVIKGLFEFCLTVPGLPAEKDKIFSNPEPLNIELDMDRNAIISRLERIRGSNETADLAFYAFRDLTRTHPVPFLLAATERNPVSIDGLKDEDTSTALEKIRELPGESIYPGHSRLAQPDEVWNYSTGDGLEKAILAANILKNRGHDNIKMNISGSSVNLAHKNGELIFSTQKDIPSQEWLITLTGLPQVINTEQ